MVPYVAKASELSMCWSRIRAKSGGEIYKVVEILANCGRARGKP